MELDWENSLDEWDGENYWERLAWENYSGPKRIWVISPTRFVHLRVRIVWQP